MHNISAAGPLHLIVDSTGLSVVGEGEWAVAKHGGRGTRGWKKLHLGVDRSGMIVAHSLTEATVDDASVGADLIGAAAGPVASVTGDAAYDTVAFYKAASARHAQVVVPPIMTARVSRHGPRSTVRDRVITDVEALGRRQWKKSSGYHQQARVENAFFRYKSIIGAGLRARMNPRIIQGVAGHENLTTTERYMHFAPGHAAQAFALLDSPSAAATEPSNRRATASA